jgi:hypothetical protein
MIHRTHPHTLRVDVVRAMMAQHRKGPRAAAAPPRAPAAADRRELWQRRLSAFVHPPRAGTADAPPPPAPEGAGKDEGGRERS